MYGKAQKYAVQNHPISMGQSSSRTAKNKDNGRAVGQKPALNT